MAELPAPLAAKVGPYPVAAWAGLIGGGVALGLIIRARRNNNPAADDGTLPVISDENGAPTSRAVTATTGAASGSGVGARTIPLPNNATSSAPTDPTTNLGWSIAAIRLLVSSGADAATAQAAVERFLAGYGLTTAERSLVGRAIAQLGPPPESAPPITSAPDAPPTSSAPTFQAPPSTPPAPAPLPEQPAPVAEQITPPGSLVSPDGNTVFWTDGIRVQWVTNGHQSVALWQSGARVKSVVNEGSPDAFPEPLYLSREAILSLRRVGPFPPGY